MRSFYSLALFVLVATAIAFVPATSTFAQKAEISTPQFYTAAEFQLIQPQTANPYIAFLPREELAKVDWKYWRTWLKLNAPEREALSKTAVINVAESEPNDSQGTADLTTGFGSGADPAASLTGTFDVVSVTSSAMAGCPKEPGAEDGSITDALASGIALKQTKTCSAIIGDGAHGSGGSGTGDFDHYHVSGTAGDVLTVDIDTAIPLDGDLDPIVALYDNVGNLVAANDDESGSNWDSFLSTVLPATGDYSVAVLGWKGQPQLQSDPFNPASGPGVGSEGDYDISITLTAPLDGGDYFALDLVAGDVLGASLNGVGTLRLLEPSGENAIWSSQNAGVLYGPANPLPAGGPAAVAYVAETDGTYALQVADGAGPYQVDVQVFRPLSTNCTAQHVMLDFDGETVDPSKWGGPPGLRGLSPLSTFTPGWGLAGQEDAVIDAVVDVFTQKSRIELATAGINPALGMGICNSRDHSDGLTYPQCQYPADPNAARVIIGGTIAELGISTIGIAQYIDPGNFTKSQDAVVLLDLLSALASNPNSLNQYGLTNGATRLDVVAAGVGHIAAHEAGHYWGLYHTNQFNGTPNLIDQGGNLDNTVGVGPNGTFDTPGYPAAPAQVDDDFPSHVRDAYVGNEGFFGQERAAPRVAWGNSTDWDELSCPPNALLPVELTSFSAVVEGFDVILNWETASETNNSHFVIEHFQNELIFEPIGSVPGAGTTSEPQAYSYRVPDLEPGTHRFRLMQIDLDGTYNYTGEVEATVEVPGTHMLSAAYPNPFNPAARFTLAVSEAQQVQIALYDVTGRLIQTVHDGELEANTVHTFTIDGSGLPSGTYVYRVIGEGFASESHSIVLQK